MITPKEPLFDEAVGQHYDELDRFYRELWGEHVHHGLWMTGRELPEEATIQLLDRVAQAAQIGSGERVCDVGCGYGGTARWLAEEFGAQVTGLTISERQFEHATAQSSSGESPTYRLGDWLTNDLPAETFDAVLFIESLAHMADKRAALREAHRVLRPGGRLVMCAWLTAEWPSDWAVRWIIEPICAEGRLPGMPSAVDVQRGLLDSGFAVHHFEDLSARVRRTWTVIIRRVITAVARRPDYRRYLMDRAQQNRRFALTLIRLWIGYRLGVIRYGFFVAEKPSDA